MDGWMDIWGTSQDGRILRRQFITWSKIFCFAWSLHGQILVVNIVQIEGSCFRVPNSDNEMSIKTCQTSTFSSFFSGLYILLCLTMIVHPSHLSIYSS